MQYQYLSINKITKYVFVYGGWAKGWPRGGKDNTRIGRIREERRKRNWKTFRMQING